MLQLSHEASKVRDPTAEPLQVGDGLVVTQIGNVCVALWRKKPTRARFEVQRSCLAAAVAKQPGRTAFLCLVEPGTEPPDDEIRKASSAMISGHGTDLKAVAIVVEGTGFKAAISRTVLSGIVFLIRSPSPVRYFESATLGAGWLRQFVPIADLAHFVEQVEAARKALAQV